MDLPVTLKRHGKLQCSWRVIGYYRGLYISVHIYIYWFNYIGIYIYKCIVYNYIILVNIYIYKCIIYNYIKLVYIYIYIIISLVYIYICILYVIILVYIYNADHHNLRIYSYSALVNPNPKDLSLSALGASKTSLRSSNGRCKHM